MKVYIVREAGTIKGHGVFWAETQEDLWMAVDKMGDPIEFEACEITRPSGVWTRTPMDEAKPQWIPGMPEDDAIALPNPLSEVGDSLSEQDSDRWVRFDSAYTGAGMLSG